MRILMTGAGGELGRALRSRLTGHEILDAKAGVADCATVLHLAGRKYDAAGTAADFEEANVSFTRSLIAKLAALSVPPRIVFFSTMYIYGESSATPWREDMEPRPGTAYGATKLAAERLIAASGLPFVVLRLATVYGTGGDDVLARMAAAYAKTGPFVVGDGGQKRSLLSLDLLASVVMKTLADPRWNGRTVNVADPEPHLMRDLARRATGRADARRVPAAFVAAASALGPVLGTRYRAAMDGLDRLGRSFELDTTRLRGLAA